MEVTKMAKNDEVAPVTGNNDSQTDDVNVVGQAGLGKVNDTPGPVVRESIDAPVEGYKLTKLKEEDVATPGLVELVVVAEGTFSDPNGGVLRTGDRLTVSNVDAVALLDVKVNGKSAFNSVV